MALKSHWRIAALFLAFAAFSKPVFAADEWEPASFLVFADHLYSEHDYLRAAGEYERYLTIAGTEGAHKDSIFLKTGFCYSGAGDFTRALDYLQKVGVSKDSAIAEEARLNIAFILFRRADYNGSLRALQTENGARANLLLALNYLHLKQWSESKQALGNVQDQDTLSPAFRKIRLADQAGLELNPKSPALAGVLSAVIPGSGKMYAGRFKDGLFSLALVGLCGVVAYEGFHHSGWKSVQGILFGSLAFGFYGGNIYGSVLAAHQDNLAREKQILEGLSFSVNARLPF